MKWIQNIIIPFFVLPKGKAWHYVSVDSLHFVILNSCITLKRESEQMKWAEHTLDSIRAQHPFAFVILLMHHPVYSSGQHGDMGKEEQAYMIQVLKKYHISLVVSGHDHNFEWQIHDGITYVVSGGGGAPLRSQSRFVPESRIFCCINHFVAMNYIQGHWLLQAVDKDGKLLAQLQVR